MRFKTSGLCANENGESGCGRYVASQIESELAYNGVLSHIEGPSPNVIKAKLTSRDGLKVEHSLT
jgi:hypothetical protein